MLKYELMENLIQRQVEVKALNVVLFVKLIMFSQPETNQ